MCVHLVIPQNELIDMVDMCALALFKLGELASPVTNKQLEEIAADTFMVRTIWGRYGGASVVPYE